ncbi:DnaJ-domain-containing protein [Amniculicola lignicola CBS 123094]|uniref:DnaJ-domain-containing protein n=1 Tax=Amniculicola lignicola CBS 123094 TaxID=1392246 RepID=A0A6A5X0U6_9PLEO|nr:DnaJ-domain-containing protein [Amniculicola lignicola CBS 123094]
MGKKRKAQGQEAKTTGQSRGLTHYEVLDLPPSASILEIKASFHALSLMHHPDKLVGHNLMPQDLENHNAVFLAANNAYEVLSDSQKKVEYDQTLDFGTANKCSEETESKTRTETASMDEAHLSEWRSESDFGVSWDGDILIYNAGSWDVQIQMSGSDAPTMFCARVRNLVLYCNALEIDVDVDPSFEAAPKFSISVSMLIAETPKLQRVTAVRSILTNHTISIGISLADRDPNFLHHELEVEDMLLCTEREFGVRKGNPYEPWSYVVQDADISDIDSRENDSKDSSRKEKREKTTKDSPPKKVEEKEVKVKIERKRGKGRQGYGKGR